MHFGRRGSVFELVFGRFAASRKFSFFTDGHKADAHRVGDGRPEQEAARIDADDFVRLQFPAGCEERIDGHPESRPIGQDRGDVFEDDARFWKIGHVADGNTERTEWVGGHVKNELGISPTRRIRTMGKFFFP